MEQSYVIICLSLIPLILFAFALRKAVVLKKENAHLSRQLAEASNALESTRAELLSLQDKQQKTDEFETSLAEAELAKKFRPARTTIQNPDTNHNTPEKYGFVHSLAQKGLSSDEIASVLTISPHEARQLVTLAKIAQGN